MAMAIRIDDLHGSPAEAGYEHGKRLPDLLDPTFREPYIRRLCDILRVEREDMSAQAARWLSKLPSHYQIEIDAMARGAGVTLEDACEFLYADIARPTSTVAGTDTVTGAGRPGEFEAIGEVSDGSSCATGAGGPMCSGALVDRGGVAWIARNCDWLSATLTRGTACVIHRTPGRIPVLALGIRGDIDIDTGMNAEGLWVHIHTLYAPGEPRGDRTCISWLFWAREALETCASLDDLERFIGATERDRGVIVLAVEGRTGARAIFECSRSDALRIDANGAAPLLATNHHQRKHPASDEEVRREDSGLPPRRGSSTIARYCGLRDEVAHREGGPYPDALIESLASERVEMRTPVHLRTIYSVVCRPSDSAIWFASGGADGKPAASRGTWERVNARL